MKSCPVCKKLNLPESCEACPQCESDLTCFTTLELMGKSREVLASPSLQKQNETSPNSNRFFYTSLVMGNFVGFCMVMGCLWISNLFKDLHSQIDRLSLQIAHASEKTGLKAQDVDDRLKNLENKVIRTEENHISTLDGIGRIESQLTSLRKDKLIRRRQSL